MLKYIFGYLAFYISLSALTIEEKVGQILMCPIHGDVITNPIEKLIQETHLGGVILYNWSNGLTSFDKIRTFNKRLQETALKTSGIPLFIAIDEEGGRVERLGVPFASASTIGNKEASYSSYEAGKQIGSLLHLLYINVNLAPVVDINSNSENTVIGNRSFGSDPKLVATCAEEFAKGLLDCHVLPCFKHFPGHGDVSVDSHVKMPVSFKILDGLLEIELIPYLQNIDLPPFIMTAHILFPNIDPNHPATLSKIILTDILRKKLQYKGIILSDSLTMAAVLSKNLTEIAIEAFNAGNDILLIGGNTLLKNFPLNTEQMIRNLHKELVEAVKDGRILAERLNESVDRILTLKATLQ